MAVNPIAPAPRQEFAQNYAQTLAGAYAPRIQGLGQYIQSLNARQANIPASVANLFNGAIQQAGNVGTNVTNTNANFMAALSGLGANLPGEGAAAHEGLAMAARQAGRGGATAALLGNVLGTQASTAQALATQEANARVAEEQYRAQQDLWNAEEEQAKTQADWMPYAVQRQQITSNALSNQAAEQQIKAFPLQQKAAKLDIMLKRGQITEQQYNNLIAKYKLNQAGIKTSKKGSGKGKGTDSSTSATGSSQSNIG